MVFSRSGLVGRLDKLSSMIWLQRHLFGAKIIVETVKWLSVPFPLGCASRSIAPWSA